MMEEKERKNEFSSKHGKTIHKYQKGEEKNVNKTNMEVLHSNITNIEFNNNNKRQVNSYSRRCSETAYSPNSLDFLNSSNNSNNNQSATDKNKKFYFLDALSILAEQEHLKNSEEELKSALGDFIDSFTKKIQCCGDSFSAKKYFEHRNKFHIQNLDKCNTNINSETVRYKNITRSKNGMNNNPGNQNNNDPSDEIGKENFMTRIDVSHGSEEMEESENDRRFLQRIEVNEQHTSNTNPSNIRNIVERNRINLSNTPHTIPRFHSHQLNYRYYNDYYVNNTYNTPRSFCNTTYYTGYAPYNASSVNSPKVFICPRPGCENQYTSAYGLKYHLENGHTKKKEFEHKPYFCDVEGCKKRFKNSNGLKYHKSHGHKSKQHKKTKN
ncbi:Transcription factor Sfp1 [Spraguea lophii 42_110]|uniref:Transcription factor Sfp1 n=1 Tax=Spraguea lophii (strain 42_110) TaxID=1358809 RepID=S7XPA8_SPRLO|nr:Transcription factor Sfp1 [Spraguea lophii 42_110]